MENNPEPIKEILDELFSLLESLETQNLALTQFLKEQGIATDEKLAPYLDRAGNTSSVKWRAARARMQYLLSPVAKKTDDQAKDKDKESEKPQAENQATESNLQKNRPLSSTNPQARTPLKIQLKIPVQIAAKIQSLPAKNLMRQKTTKSLMVTKNRIASNPVLFLVPFAFQNFLAGRHSLGIIIHTQYLGHNWVSIL
jgi:hypothetical protein